MKKKFKHLNYLVIIFCIQFIACGNNNRSNNRSNTNQQANTPPSMEKSGGWTFFYKQDLGTSHIINDKCSYLCGSSVSCNFMQSSSGEIWFSSPDASCKSEIKYTYDANIGLLNITEIISGKSYSSSSMNYDNCYDVFKGKYKWEKRDELVGFRFYSLSNPNLSLYCSFGNCSNYYIGIY